MKKNIGIFLLILLGGVFLHAQQIDVYSRPLQTERSHDYNALHYLIKIDLDITGKSFRGETTVTLLPLRDGFDRCILDAEEFTVASVVNNWGESLTFEQSEKKLIVYFKRAYKYGESVGFTVSYQGREPKIGLRFYDKSSDKPALVASDSWPDHVHHWFPCYDYPNDKVTNEVIATVPQDYKVVANGRLVSIKAAGEEGKITYHWSQEKPHSTYLIFLAAAPYVVVRNAYKNIPINYWVYPQHEAIARISFKDTPKMMAFFNRIYGYEYPWAKYDQVVVPFGGGAESTSASAMGQRIMHDEKAEKDFSNIGIVSHELAHQWWGDLITLRSWAHAWMNESFGTYSDYLYYRFDRGDEEGAVNLLGKKNAYLREAHNRYIRPIVFFRYNRPQDNFDSHTYPKGAVVLHMLRFVIGDDAFFRVLKTFLHEYAFQPVETSDFTKTVKNVTGQTLKWFFDQWLFSPGHPVFDVAYTWDPEVGKIRLNVRQIQDTSGRVPVFKMPVKIGIVTPEGKNIHSIWIKKPEETWEFPAAQKPLLVRFDEGNYLLKEWEFKKSREELFYQLGHDDVIGRMWAAAELGGFINQPGVLQQLKKSAEKDAFWAVRRNSLLSLGKHKEAELISWFKERCRDLNSRVRVVALQVLGDYNRRDLAGFLQERFRREDSYLAQAEAIHSIGKCGDNSMLPFLQKAELVSSPRDVIKKAAQSAVKTLRREIN